MKLNSEQQRAVLHEGGPLLIIAGAGTGKTTVITQKIKYLVQEKKVNPQHIFATTFTEKTAVEILERLDTVMPLGYTPPWLGTFHSLCDRFLRQEGLEIGIDPNFTIMTPADQWIFLKEHLFDLPLSYYRPLGNPGKFIGALATFFSRLQDEDVSDEEFAAVVSGRHQKVASEDEKKEAERIEELYQTYLAYNQLKIKFSVFDFGDLIIKTLHLLRQRPNIVAKLRRQFQHILVDEFQDTNYAQFKLIQLLAPPDDHPNLTVVGDDDQSIYKFRGASVANILAFKEIYPKAGEVVLNQNYRSTQPILDAAYRVIQHNNPDRLEAKLRIDKRLKAQVGTPPNSPQLIEFATETEEVETIADTILELITKKNLSPKDIAVLSRSNAGLEPFVMALRRRHIPYQLVANRGLFDQPEVKQLLFLLEILSDPENSTVLFQLLSAPPFSLNPSLLFRLLSRSRKNASSLWVELSLEEDQSIKKAVELIHKYQTHALKLPVSQLLHEFIVETEYFKPYLLVESSENVLKLKNIALLFEKIIRFERTATDTSISKFLDVLLLWLESGENPGQAEIEDIDTVSLMTIHAAKGLEFEAVFLTSLIAGRFPSTNRKDPISLPDELIKDELPEGDAHLEEERRLFYVAMTRAKSFLQLSYATDYGGVRKRKPSGFTQETDLQVQSAPKRELELSSAVTPSGVDTVPYEFTLKQVSYSQLDTYKACPLKYKYRYILRLPAKPHQSLTYGRSIHNTLYDFHTMQQQGKILKKEELIALYEKHFDPTGYDSKKDKQERFEAGKKELSRYYQKFKNLGGTPELLEQEFNLKIGDVTVKGKIDRIDKTPTGYEIIDYKTGKPKSQKDVDRDDQLSIYTLAAKEALNLEIEKASLYFLQSGEKITTVRTPAQKEKVKIKLENQINEIKNSNFKATPDERTCSFCEFKRICVYSKAK